MPLSVALALIFAERLLVTAGSVGGYEACKFDIAAGHHAGLLQGAATSTSFRTIFLMWLFDLGWTRHSDVIVMLFVGFSRTDDGHIPRAFPSSITYAVCCILFGGRGCRVR